MEPRRPTLRRRLRRLAAPLLVVALATACGSGPIGAASAATVDGTAIAPDDVRELIDAQVAYFEAAREAGLVPDEQLDMFEEQLATYRSEGRDAMPTAGAAEALTSLIELEVLEGLLAERDGDVDDAEVDTLRSQLVDELEQQGITEIDDIDALIDAESRRQAVLAALTELIADPDEREEQLAELFEAAVGDFTQLCSLVLVTDDEDSARAGLDRIEAGEDFAAVAAEVSTDEGVAEAGGDIGCQAAADIAGLIGDVAFDAEPGDRIGPLEVTLDPTGETTSWLVLEVTEVDVPTLEDIRPQLEAQLPEPGQEALREAVGEAFAEADVSVQSRYGTWDGELGRVEPPVDPSAPPTTAPEDPFAGVEPAPEAAPAAP